MLFLIQSNIINCSVNLSICPVDVQMSCTAPMDPHWMTAVVSTCVSTVVAWCVSDCSRRSSTFLCQLSLAEHISWSLFCAAEWALTFYSPRALHAAPHAVSYTLACGHTHTRHSNDHTVLCLYINCIFAEILWHKSYKNKTELVLLLQTFKY